MVPGSPASFRSLRRTSVSSPQVPLGSCPVAFLSVWLIVLTQLAGLGSFSLRGFAAGAVWVRHLPCLSLSRFIFLFLFVPPPPGSKTTPALWFPASPVPEVLGGRTVPNSLLLAAGGRGARGVGDSQAWHLCFLRERQLALPWPCGTRESVAGIAASFCQVPAGVSPRRGFGMGFNFSW